MLEEAGVRSRKQLFNVAVGVIRARISIDLVVRAAARIERLAKIQHGSMAFKAPNK
jgi:hypothetical protein